MVKCKPSPTGDSLDFVLYDNCKNLIRFRSLYTRTTCFLIYIKKKPENKNTTRCGFSGEKKISSMEKRDTQIDIHRRLRYRKPSLR